MIKIDLSSKNILVAGSSGAIGQELCKQFKVAGANVWSLSRHESEAVDHFCIDLSKQESVESLKEQFQESKIKIDGVINCAGLLHDETNLPERQLRDIKDDWLLRSMEVNLLSHIHLAQSVEGFMEDSKAFKWMSLSAMVGSIEDNGLGGWYSYRISKVGLNMFIKGLSIEWKRKNKELCVVAVHPGTTESKMSKIFKIKKDKLYSAELSASRLLKIYGTLTNESNGQFLNWDGSQLAW
ncbi:SDR family NAD(P)-dependent oxidoreductase [Lentisphaera profundi]|uniref:SDR family NAD(P)-dependent oxidoreductase n=1 Tax=Lentisphaera profundi TaxID=1658616 RepID=A0ABY7VZ48_9BACT|nr:SDR family NAD(P)-dependent oxidoreductase [Lentisphaera profundi]WDE98977.1 SDR family NAD(P)-dependent oxidoreductase [Lentisphaera profundi]